MKIRWLVVASALLGIVAADPALAQSRKKKPIKPQCVDQPFQFSWEKLFFDGGPPPPNGCAPPVYQYGRYVGQDPDPFIRQQLMRDPATGYGSNFK